MRRLKQAGMTALALFSLAVAIPASARQLSISALVQKNNVSWTEAAAAVVIAQALGLDAQIVITTGRHYAVPVYGLGPTYYFCNEYHLPFDQVWKLRKRGHGWGQIAHELGIHPGDFNKMRNIGDFDRYSWYQMLQKRYDWRDSEFAYYENRGVSRPQLITNIVLSNGNRKAFESKVHVHRATQPPVQRIQPGNRNQGKGHGDNGRGEDDWGLSKHQHRDGTEKLTPKANGNGRSKGIGKQKEQGSGRGVGHGNEHGNGHGNSNGGGNGHGHGHGGG